ncbi:MAG: PPK2 family polyphosphate kinase, partial [Anaerolineaceae bacterium]
MSQPLIPPRGKKFEIKEYSSSYTGDASKDVAAVEITSLRLRLDELQNLLYADGRFGVLIVLQAIDAGGKDGTVKSVFREVGPLGCSVVSFGVPTKLELAHDYLWRYHQKAPERGDVVIFNRSHYESVLVERVRDIVPKDVWKARYDQMNRFESYISSQGTVIMKFFLHVSKEVQRQRLQARVDDPKKHWKYRMADLDDRKLWDDYQSAFEDMVDNCNTEHAPWHVVPADHNWYRDLVVARALVQKLESM